MTTQTKISRDEYRKRYERYRAQGLTPSVSIAKIDNEIKNLPDMGTKKRVSTDPVIREQNRANNREKIKKIGSGLWSGLGKIAKGMGENIAHNRRVSSGGGRRAPKRSRYYDDEGTTPDIYGGDMLSSAMGLGGSPRKKHKKGRKKHSSGRKSKKSRSGKQIIINL